MDELTLSQALIAIAVALVAAGSVAAVAIKIISAMLNRMLHKVENAPDEKTVQTMIDMASLKIEGKMQSEIQLTRHDLRQEMTNHLLPLNVKIEETGRQLTQLLIAIGAMQATVSHLPKRKGDVREGD